MPTLDHPNDAFHNRNIELMDLASTLNIQFKMFDLIQNLLNNCFVGGPVVPAGMDANDTCLCTSKMIGLVVADCRKLVADAVQSVNVSVEEART